MKTNIINLTPHPITFWSPGDEDVTVIESSGVLSAEPVETTAKFQIEEIELVRTEFYPTQEGWKLIERTIKECDEALGHPILVGSIIAAQAYPGRVFAMTPAPGYERVPPAEKRMNPYKFTIFQ